MLQLNFIRLLIIATRTFLKSNKKIGDVLALDASSYSSYDFAFWVVNGVVRDDLNPSSSIKVQSSMDIQAVFHKAGEHAVLFIDSNGKLIDGTYVLDGGSNSLHMV